MALRALMLKKKLDGKKKELEQLRAEGEKLDAQEKELEKSVEEAETEEEQKTVEEAIKAFEEAKKEYEESKEKIEKAIADTEEELKKLEEGQPDEPDGEGEGEEPPEGRGQRKRGNGRRMETRKKFFGMTAQERDAFLQREDVKNWLQRTREIGLANISNTMQRRGVTGADLTIPEVVLEVIRENVMDYAKLVNRVRLVSVSGKARQTVMGTIPEAVWTEACATLNELDFGFTQVEVDGYKVGGIVYICKATLEDSDLNLAQEIMNALGIAIGIALDKAILYGNGVKMPLGIVPRLAQDSQPSDYPAVARPWENLNGNLITIDGEKHGLDFFKEIVTGSGKAKEKYSRGTKFWAMNETTYTTIVTEAMTFNNAGAIVSVQDGTMPVIGGDLIVLSDDVIPDNNIVAGYGDLYLLAERAGSEFARSDEYRFAEDQIAFKGTARYDGMPVIAEGFIAIGIGAAPVESATFAGDKANDASLAGLEIGTETLDPAFDPAKTTYTIAAASAASATVTASPAQKTAKVNVTYDEKNYGNNATIKWKADGTAHPLTIEVKNGASVRTYTVNVTKANGAG